MERLTREGLRALREEQARVLRREDGAAAAAELVVGMATCGIAAGAQATREALAAEIERNHVKGVRIRQTGCMGLCHAEPTVEVMVEGMPTVVYGRVDAETARRIVLQHIIGRQLLDDRVYDKPAADLVPGAGPSGE